jgi:hypothetical protein
VVFAHGDGIGSVVLEAAGALPAVLITAPISGIGGPYRYKADPTAANPSDGEHRMLRGQRVCGWYKKKTLRRPAPFSSRSIFCEPQGAGPKPAL